MKRVATGLIVLLILALAVAFFLFRIISNQSIPDYTVHIEMSGLTAEVEVIRDAFGIPHIYAQNEADLYRAVGYVMAQDRLFQMDLQRRVTTGRLSELFGPDFIRTDHLLRALQMPAKSEMVLAQTDEQVLKSLQAFSEGVNRYITDHKNKLPPEFVILRYHPEPWQPQHSVNLIGYMGWDLAVGWSTDVLLHELSTVLDSARFQAFIPDTGLHPTAVFSNFREGSTLLRNSLLSALAPLHKLNIQVFSGSNNWAVSGKKSETGRPLLANDMHLGFNIPGIWMQMHQIIPGELNVTGVVLPGQPLVICGHNDSIAWGMTNVAVDNLDFFRETISADSTSYLFNGEWIPLHIAEEQIRSSKDDSTPVTLRFTHRGPLVSDLKELEGEAISMRWTGNDYSNELTGVYKLNRARNWADFREAAREFKAVSQNIVYADVRGNIGLQCSAGIPVRPGNAYTIHPGKTDAYDWLGMVPFEELPFEYNPERGYVSSANNKTVDESYPYYISHWFALPARINRIREMLESKERFSSADFQQMLTDVKSNLAEEFLPLLLSAMQGMPDMDTRETEVLERMDGWDYRLRIESPEASIFETWMIRIIRNTILDELGPELTEKVLADRTMSLNLLINALNGQELWFNRLHTPEQESFSDIVRLSFTETIEQLNELLGESPGNWGWGNLHTLTLKHPLGQVSALNRLLKLNRGPFPVPGSHHTVAPFAYSFTHPYEAYHGASQRHIYDASEWDHSLSVIPTGTSGIPGSRHYCDQTDLYLNGLFHADPFTRTAVEAHAAYRMKFYPEKR